jgi:hypothetical protein
MTDIVYVPNHGGIGDMLNSEMMRISMEVIADEIMIRAIVIAPVDTGRYKASFHVKSHLNGGATSDRAEAIMYNDAPDALSVEYGKWGNEPYHTIAHAAFVPIRGRHK